jgi:hypothetical protein
MLHALTAASLLAQRCFACNLCALLYIATSLSRPTWLPWLQVHACTDDTSPCLVSMPRLQLQHTVHAK